MALDELVGEFVDEVGAPVALQALRVEPVEQALKRWIWHRSDAVQEWRADVVHGCQQPCGVLLGADDAPHHRADLAQMELLWEEVHRRYRHLCEEPADIARSRGKELAIKAHHLRRLLDRPERRPGHHRSANRVRAEVKRRNDTEVAAATAQRPEQLGMLVRTCMYP